MSQLDDFLDGKPGATPAAKNQIDTFLDGGAAEPGLIPTVKRTGGQMLTTAATSIEDVTGPNAVTKAMQETGQGIIDRNPAGITKLSDVVEKPWLAVKESVGQFAPQIGAAAAGGFAGARLGGALGSLAGPGGAAAGAALGGVAGSRVPIFTQEYGGIRQEQKEVGQEDKARALAAAVPATALERVGMGKALNVLKGVPIGAGSVLKEAGKGVLKEGATEGAQNVIEQVGAFKDPTAAENLEDTALSAVMGGIGGGVMGAGAGAIDVARQRDQQAASTTPEPAQPPAPATTPEAAAPLALPAPDPGVIEVSTDGTARTPAYQAPGYVGDVTDVEPRAVNPVREQVAAAAEQGGALSSAALTAIDTGLSDAMQPAPEQAPPQISLEEADARDRAAYEQFFAGFDADPVVSRYFENDDDIPDFDAASNASEEDFLRALGATDEDIQDAIATSSQSAIPQSSVASNAGPQAYEPAGPREGAGEGAASQTGQVNAGAIQQAATYAPVPGVGGPVGADGAGSAAAAVSGASGPGGAGTGAATGSGAGATEAGIARTGGRGDSNQALSAPTNLRDALVRVRQQKQEAANAQAAQAPAPAAAQAVPTAGTGAVEAAGVARSKLLTSLEQTGATREAVLDAKLKAAQDRLTQMAGATGILPADKASRISEINQEISSLNAVRDQARQLDERDRREGSTRSMLQGARQELDAAVRAGAITPEAAQAIASNARNTGNAADASGAIFAAVDSSTTGANSEPAPPQAIQASPQPTQAAAAPAAAAGLTDGAPTENTGAQAAPATGAQAAAPAEPEFTTIKTVYGDSVTVRTADLNGNKQRLRQYTKDGKSKAVPAIHRDNLDLTGDKRKASAKEDADNPFFNVITTKDGSTFASQAAASRELNRLAMGETHEVVAASEVQDGAQGFVIQRKLADAMNGRAEIGMNTAPAAALQQSQLQPAPATPMQQGQAEAKEATYNGTQVEAEQLNQYLTAEKDREEPAATQDADEQQSPQDFIPAPDGGLDYGEITPEMGKAMRRQAGKIRLQHGVQNSNGTGWGLVHIEANHGKQISGLGFGSVQDFVAHVASSIQQVWQVPGNSQLLLTLKDGRKDVMYIQLEIAKEGDFYRVNSAFPVRQEDYESLKGMKKIWDGSEPTSAVTGQRPAFATAASASPESESSQGSSNARGQDASVPPPTPEAQPVAAKQPTSEPKGAIQDFGQKIGGARKDVWSGFKDDLNSVGDDDIAAQPLAKVWPAPDYQKLIDAGMNAKSVAAVRALRDEVPAKPRAAWKVKRWAEQVKTLRGLANDVMDGKITVQDMERMGANKGAGLRGMMGRIELYELVGHGKSLEGVRFGLHHYTLYRGRENVDLWVVEKDSGASTFSNWPTEIATGDTKEQALAAFKEKYDSLDLQKAVRKASFDIFSERTSDGFFIGKKIGRNYAKLEGPFKTVKEAREYRQNNLPALEIKLEKYKEIPRERADVNQPRVGVDMRNGQDVTPQMFSDVFGFRGVEFGNWVEQKRRQKDLNDAFDALMDMAAVLDIPTKAISLNGKLGLAFGARGSGGVNPAAAHYEPDSVVINLTKKEGAGSLGHEWWHALDNYFAKQRKVNRGSFMTTGTDVGLAARGKDYVYEGGIRQEMIDAFGAVVKAINLTAMKARASKLDSKRTKEYWTTGEEMSARAFESYLISKLQDQNASNDYLANVVSEKTWDAMAALGLENDGSYPYPTAAEIPAIRAGFDHFFQTVETRADDAGNVAMFSRVPPGLTAEEAVAMFNAANQVSPDARNAQRRISDARLVATQQLIDGIKEKWARAPEIIVARNMQDSQIPQAVRDYDQTLKSQGATGEPRGFIYKGKVYLLSDELSGPAQIAEVLFHEVLGHYGLRGAFGDGLKPILQQIGTMRRRDVLAKAREYGMVAKGLSDADTLAAMSERDRLSAAEEVLAEMAQRTPEIGFVQRAIAAIRTWLRSNVPGFKNLALTDDEIVRSYIIPARGFVNRSSETPQQALERAQVAFSRGDQDGGAPMFSRAGMADLASKARDELNRTFTAPGKLSWWHKTVGTMYNLAERSPAFKRVFEAAQGFVDDVSYYATDAAEQAPRLLPKLETWRDIAKRPITAADNAAVAKPVFEGTLVWTRDEAGKPVRVDDLAVAAEKLTAEEKARRLLLQDKISAGMLRAWQGLPLEQYEKLVESRYESQMLKAGIVWTPAELKSMFKLTDDQVALYKEFRTATDRSLDTMARSDMLRYGGKDVADLRDMVMDAADAQDAAQILRDHLQMLAKENPERAGELGQLSSGMLDRAAKVQELQEQGYAPLSRFGKYTVDVVDANGERQYFGLFETQREANIMAMKMRKGFGQDAVSQGTLSNEEFKLLAGITPESLELFGNMLGLDSTGDDAQDQAFQEYLRRTKTNRSAMRRLIHRQGIAGYSEDVGRVLASFIYSNARQTSAGLHMGELGEAVTAIPKQQGELKDAAVQLSEYVKNPQEEAQAIRGLLFAQYLGGSIASAVVNMSQPAAVTFPWLSQFGGAKQAAAELGRAAKNLANKAHRYEADLAAALKQAEEEGTVSPQEVHQLMAQARGSGSLRPGDGTRTGDALASAGNALTRLSLAWGKVFGAAEQVNRRMTYIAAFRIAKAQKMDNPAAFAKKAVIETQFTYSKANKMKWGRGAVGATVMTFKTYSVAYLELLGRMWSQGGPEGKKAVLLALGMLMLMGGAGGLPFAEDAEDLVDGLAQLAGYNFNSKKAKQELLESVFGQAGAGFVERGITGLPGMPLDVSVRLGMGNLLPGTGIFKEKTDYTRDVLEVVGPVGDLAKRAASGARSILAGDVGAGLLQIAPAAVRNAAKGADMAATGMYRDDKGYKVLDTSPAEAAMKAIGFQPASVAKVQEANFINQQAKNFYNMKAQEIRAKWARGIFEKDQGIVAEARADLEEWNRKNPEQRIVVSMPAVLKRVREMSKTKDQRIADTAPRAMRQQMREETEKARATL